MEGKLIKLELSEGYRLDDLNGNYIASTLNGKNKLSLKNCEEIELGFSLVELFDKVDRSIDYHEFDFASFRLGVKAVLEILGDKKFSEEDIRNAMGRVWYWHEDNQDKDCLYLYNLENKVIKSLQQTEWDVIIEMEAYHDGDFINDGKTHIIEAKLRPRLDSGGCLILKRK